MKKKQPDHADQSSPKDGGETPQILALKREGSRWQLSRRGFIAAAAGGAAVEDAAAHKVRPTRLSVPAPLAPGPCAHTGTVTTLAFTPDGKSLVSGSDDTLIKVWEMPGGAYVRTLRGHSGFVRSLVVTPKTSRIISGGGDGDLGLWDLKNTDAVSIKNAGSSIGTVAVTPDESLIALSTGNVAIRLWKLSLNPNAINPDIMTARPESINSLAVDPTGASLASVSARGKVRRWSLPQLQLEWSKFGPLLGANAVIRYSPDGANLITGGNGGIHIWSVAKGKIMKSLKSKFAVESLAVSPNGALLVTGHSDFAIRVWDFPDGGLRFTLTGHEKGVTSLAITPDSLHLASGSADRTIRLWDLADGKFIARLMDLEASLNSVKGVQYKSRTDQGTWVTYTLPCGSPIPAGAVCVCNCVPGSYAGATTTTHTYTYTYTYTYHYWYPN